MRRAAFPLLVLTLLALSPPAAAATVASEEDPRGDVTRWTLSEEGEAPADFAGVDLVRFELRATEDEVLPSLHFAGPLPRAFEASLAIRIGPHEDMLFLMSVERPEDPKEPTEVYGFRSNQTGEPGSGAGALNAIVGEDAVQWVLPRDSLADLSCFQLQRAEAEHAAWTEDMEDLHVYMDNLTLAPSCDDASTLPWTGVDAGGDDGLRAVPAAGVAAGVAAAALAAAFRLRARRG